MSSARPPARRPVLVTLCGILLALAIGCLAAATAEAAQYKALLCAGNNGSNGYGVSMNTPNMYVNNACGPAPDPAGGAALLQIAENQPAGNMSQGAYAFVHWDTPPYVHFKTAGGWTRQPDRFNDGWRSRFWGINFANQGFEILSQGAGMGITPHFAPHIWPGWGADFWRFAFELTCVRPAGCDRAGWNGTEINTITFTLNDDQDAQVSMTPGSPLMQGGWVRGAQTATWNLVENGSGVRFERVRVDGHTVHTKDYRPWCNLDASQASGEFARVFQPCPTGGPFSHGYMFETAHFSDGAHSLQVCAQDYGQAVGMNGTGSESCDQRAIYTDNTPPGAPVDLRVISANPERYLSKFDAVFSLPPNQGSPITKVHYAITDPAGKVLVAEKTATGTNPTGLRDIASLPTAGDYRLRVRLEDAVGLVGAAASVPIPRDTKPPAAPQELSVAAPGATRSSQAFDVRWRNIVDAGAPISAFHYEIVNAAGQAIVPTRHVSGDNPQAIENLDAPRESGAATLRLWLSDAEGNVGAPVTAPLAYRCLRSDVGGGLTLSAGFGAQSAQEMIVAEGQGATLSGRLRGAGSLAGAPVCVFSRVVTQDAQHFLGIAMVDGAGDFKFAVAAGPSRHVSAVYRPGQRELTASATLKTKVRPTFGPKKKVVRNKRVAVFTGSIPGPENENVVVVLQVEDGKKRWRVFRRYRTREGGSYLMRYRFTQTKSRTTYRMRAEVPSQSGYAYEGGTSAIRKLIVIP